MQFKYNREEFKNENVIKFLLKNNIFKNKIICKICEHLIKLVNIKNRIDGKFLGCKKRIGTS